MKTIIIEKKEFSAHSLIAFSRNWTDTRASNPYFEFEARDAFGELRCANYSSYVFCTLLRYSDVPSPRLYEVLFILLSFVYRYT